MYFGQKENMNQSIVNAKTLMLMLTGNGTHSYLLHIFLQSFRKNVNLIKEGLLQF